MPPDGGRGASHWNMLGFIPLRNFAWRRRALACHDLHHVLTGYPCNVAGELQDAAWEFAAGRFPHAAASLFCLPLVGIGAIGMPRRSFAAFLRGRHSRRLYASGATPQLLALDLAELRRQQLPAGPLRPGWRDRAAWSWLVTHSLALIAVPLLVAGLPLLLLS